MKQVLQQVTQLWSQLGINQRILLAVSALGVIGAMAALLFWASRPQMQLLFGRLAEKDAAEVVAAVQAAGVKYQLGGGGSSIYVPADQVHRLRMDLAAKGVPAGEGIGFEIFDRSNFGISDFVQRTNYLRAVQGELARTIGQLNGVRSARVMVVLPENRLLFSEAKARPTASVFVDVSSSLNSDTINSIRWLVANSVEGLRVDDVAVVDSHGSVLSENLKDDPSLGSASSQIKYRKSIEDYFARKVETMLATALGAGNAIVRVSAEIDAESSTKTEERFDPESQVVRSETTAEDNSTTNERENSGGSQPVGVSANVPAPGGVDATSKSGKNSEQVRKNKTQNYEINRTVLNATKNPGTITRLTAAVFVAAKAQPRTPEELEGLRKMVMGALGIKGGAETESAVSLQEVPLEGQALEKKSSWLDGVYNHLDFLRNAVAIGIALLVFLFFVKQLKRTQPEQIPIELLQSQTDALPASPGAISPAMLNDMIRQKPENVGASLRGYLAHKS